MAENEQTGILDLALDKIPVERVLSNGEYAVKVTSCEQKISQNSGNPMLRVILKATQEKDVASIFHYIGLPGPNDDSDAVNSKLRRVKDFMVAFGADISGPIDPKSLVGAEGFAILKEVEDDEYGKQNKVSRFTAKA